MRKLLALLLFSCCSWAVDITWVRQAPASGIPWYIGWAPVTYDPVSHQTIYWGIVPTSVSIYASDLYFYQPNTNTNQGTWTHWGGTGELTDLCWADTSTLPGSRHPYNQVAIDTTRNWWWISGGANQGCNAGAVTVTGTAVVNGSLNKFVPSNWVGQSVQIGGVTCGTISAVADGDHLTLSSGGCTQGPTTLNLAGDGNLGHRADLYYLPLTATPASDVWSRLQPANWPLYRQCCAMIYDPDDDVIVWYGYDSGADTSDTSVYCRTTENPTPGTLTAKQSAAGCSVNGADEWSVVSVTYVGTGHPPSLYPGLAYDTVTKKAYLFGGGVSGSNTPNNTTWKYDVPTKVWTEVALSTTAPPLVTSGVPLTAFVYNSNTHMMYYHSKNASPTDWLYNPALDTWTQLTTSGSGYVGAEPAKMTYDSCRNVLVALNPNTSGSGNPAEAEIWIGVLAGGPTACGVTAATKFLISQ